MSEMNKNYEEIGAFILDKLKKELFYYETIYELTSQQKQAISQGDTSSLMKILVRKQKYIMKIDDLERQITQSKPQWDDIKNKISPSLKEELRGLTQKITALLEDMVNMEEHNMNMLDSLKEKTSKKLNDISLGKDAVKSYLISEGTRRSKFVDKKL